MSQQTMLTEEFGITWLTVRDGDARGLDMFRRHYSHGKNRRTPGAAKGNAARFAGPSFQSASMVLLTPACDAVFVWRYEKFRNDNQTGVNCAIFRNEGPTLSSDLIIAACELAWHRWPGLRLFTFVDASQVRSANPGYCFIVAGWRRCGVTKTRRLLVFERLPE